MKFMGIPELPECLSAPDDENQSATMPVNLATTRLT
jgi:hypothetical protein